MKKIALTLALCCCALIGVAQQTLDSKQMVGITPMMYDQVKLPADAKASMILKLRQAATQNGFGSTSQDFAITADVVTVDKQHTTTAPIQFIVELQVSIYVVNALDKVIVNETSMSVKGIGNYESKAVINAINQINAKTPEMRSFMNQSRTKIIDYYTTHVPAIMKKASSLAESGQYDVALRTLASVPTCVDQYPAVADMLKDIYLKKLDSEAQIAINKANALIATGDYSQAVDAIVKVNPLSPYSKQVSGVINNLDTKFTATEKQQAEMKLKGYEVKKAEMSVLKSEAELNKTIVDSAAKVAQAQADTATAAMLSVGSWLFR